ncbi:MAG: transcriptional regulator [Desulfovibrionales bacterium GWA2_65_9]|nr:MAG: transcriptional regulator [Desulfovibrionales bacterium GWA2_65_9]
MRTVDPVKHEAKRREILDAAGRCFARKGFQGATISNICAEAKISPGHLYHYFASKEAIVGAIAEVGLEANVELLARIMAKPDAIAALVAEVRHPKDQREKTGQVLLLDMLVEAGRNPAMAGILQEHSRKLQTLLADFIRKGQARGQIDPGLDPEVAAGIVLCVGDGMRALALRNPEVDMGKSLDTLKILLSRFLTPQKP